MTLGEILERRSEAAKFRAQQSYKEAKAHRQNKIKSKKFHRIARKAKIKQQMKDFELLQKTDPEKALEKLEALDKTRAEERMSLRHKSTGQWAKNKQVRAKYDTESRKVLAQQLSISRDLTQKVRKTESDEEEEDDDDDVVGNDNNPWTNPGKTSSEIDEFVLGYRKYWDEKNKKEAEEKSKGKEDIVQGDIPEGLNPVEEVIEEFEGISDKKSPKKIKKSPKKSKKDEIIEENSELNLVGDVIEENEQISDKKIAKTIKKSQNKSKELKEDEIIEENSEFTIEKVKFKGKTIKLKKSEVKFTSDWAVETFPSLQPKKLAKPLDIDELFEKMEGKLKSKLSKKARRVKQKIRKLGKYEDSEENEDSEEEMTDLSFKNRKVRTVIDEALEETDKNGVLSKSKNLVIGETISDNSGMKLKRKADIDPSKFIAVKPKHLKTQLPDDVMVGEAMDDSDDEDEKQRNIISEAFADDDVVGEFQKDKEDEVIYLCFCNLC